MVDGILSENPFFMPLISKLEQPSIIFGSESDKVVSDVMVKKLVEKIEATECVIYDKKRNIGHNDYITGPIIAQEIAEKIITFFLGEKNIWD